MGDSPLTGDHLAAKLPVIVRAVEQSELSEDTRKRIRDPLSTSNACCGREALGHIRTA